MLFGEGAGDIKYEDEDLHDSASGPNALTVPIIYFRSAQSTFYVSSNCYG